LRGRAVEAIRDLVQAGFRLEDIFDESDLRQSQEEIRALFEEAASRWPARVSSNGQMIPPSRNGAVTQQGDAHRLSNATAGAISRPTLDHASTSPVALPGLGSNTKARTVNHTKLTEIVSNETKSAPLGPKLATTHAVIPSNTSTGFKSSASVPASKPSLNREQYLAKLAAARKKTTRESPANTSTDRASSMEQTPSIASTVDPKPSEPLGGPVGQSEGYNVDRVQSSTPASVTISLRTEQDATKAELPKMNTIKTDILKQRLEALRKATLAKAAQEKAHAESSSRPSTPAIVSPPNETPDPRMALHTRSFSGNNLSAAHEPASVLGSNLGAIPAAEPANGTRKRPVAADFITNNSPPKRPIFRRAVSPELCVIDVSDSEEEDGMEVDTLNGSPRTALQASQLGLSMLNYSPLRPLSGAQTPDPAATEKLKDLESKKKQLEAKIAAMEQRKAKAAKGESLPPTPALLRSVSTPVPVLLSSKITSPLSPAPLDENLKRKMQQKVELDTQLLMKQARIEELRLQMLQVEEEFKQQQIERDSIAADLESMGVDTEGMSLAQLRETQEVLHAKQEMQDEASGLQATTDSHSEAESIVVHTPPDTGSGSDEEYAPPVVQPEDFPSGGFKVAAENDSDSNSSEQMDLDDDEPPVVESNEPSLHVDSNIISSPESGELEEQVESGEMFSTPEAGAISIPDYIPPPTMPPVDESSTPNLAIVTDLDVDIGKKPDLIGAAGLVPTMDGTDMSESLEQSDHSLPESDIQDEPADESAEQDDEMDIESHSSSSDSSDEDDYEPTLEVHQDPSPAPFQNVAPELRHYQEALNEKVGMPPQTSSYLCLISQPSPKGSALTKTFTPYESALKSFKAYRYHPQFLQTVPHGFNSLTYSNKINPSKPMCPYELAGGSCNDPDCPNQHIRDMALSGASDSHIIAKP
jgi:hypothetical protein